MKSTQGIPFAPDGLTWSQWWEATRTVRVGYTRISYKGVGPDTTACVDEHPECGKAAVTNEPPRPFFTVREITGVYFPDAISAFRAAADWLRVEFGRQCITPITLSPPGACTCPECTA